MKKRILSVLLTVSMIIGIISANAVSITFDELSNEQETNSNIYFEEIETNSETIETNNETEISLIEDENINYEEVINSPEATNTIENIQPFSLRSSTPFDITLTPNTDGYGSVSLDWSNYDYKDKNFKVYKSDDGGNTYETVGIDYTLIEEVKCLQIYPIPSTANQLKTWMETNGYGKGIIKIDSVSMDAFNANPDAYLKDVNGNYKYDVIFFGTYDSNGEKFFNTNSTNSTENFIKSGRGCIMGHDILGWNSTIALEPSFFVKQLSPYFNLTFAPYENEKSYAVSDKVQITNKGLFTNYPWYIGEIGTILTIPPAHNVGQVANGKIWLQFSGSNNYPIGNIRNNYLTTWNNCASIMTGHSNGQATADEQKIIANLIFYCNQLIFDTWYSKDSSAQDFAKPNAPTLNVAGTNFTFSATDNGSTYHYYVESFDKNDTTATGLLDTSVTKSLTVTTGVKKYRYILDNSASTTVTLSNGTETTATSIPENRSYNYLHVAAIDGAGNLGSTTTVAIPKTANVTINHYKMNLDGTSYTLAETSNTTGTIGNNVTPAVKSYTGFTSPSLQTKTIVSGGITINYYYTRNKYSVTYIDKNSSNSELGRTTKQVYYESTVRGSDLGNSTADNAYYNQYRYVSDTSATVNTNGVTVYRIFEFCKTEKESHLTWNDNNDADKLRPDKYTLKLKQNGTVIDEVELPSTQTDYTFDNLPKYDTNGNPYDYELETIVSDRYKTNVDDAGNLIIEDYQPANFTVTIPKKIALNGNTGKASYAVSVNGTFYYNDTLTVKPEATFTLTDRSNISSMTGYVNQIKTGFTKEDLPSSANGSISINRTYFSGSWQGNFNFAIKFKKQN